MAIAYFNYIQYIVYSVHCTLYSYKSKYFPHYGTKLATLPRHEIPFPFSGGKFDVFVSVNNSLSRSRASVVHFVVDYDCQPPTVDIDSPAIPVALCHLTLTPAVPVWLEPQVSQSLVQIGRLIWTKALSYFMDCIFHSHRK